MKYNYILIPTLPCLSSTLVFLNFVYLEVHEPFRSIKVRRRSDDDDASHPKKTVRTNHVWRFFGFKIQTCELTKI